MEPMGRTCSWSPAKAATVAAAIVLSACSANPSSSGDRQQTPATTAQAEAKPDPASVKANELGVIPVLMYHRLTPTPKAEYDRRPDDFRAELQRLHDSGYRPVLARDLIAGTMDVPAGKTPVILTFDDTTPSQYRLGPDGQVGPDTAIGILLEFSKSHPDFKPVATMYVNGNPFEAGAGTRELQDLTRRGFELGAHTLTHANLGKADSELVQKELVQGLRVIKKAVPDEKVVTMALPFGVRPTDRALAHEGSWDGERYLFDGIFLVGSEPSPSPFSADFDPLGVPRIRSADWDGGKANFGTAFWLDTLDSRPERRYVSDGDPGRVSFPSSEQAKLGAMVGGRAQPY